jgi:hypothetical protein
VLARFGLIPYAPPVFTPCARAPLAGLLLWGCRRWRALGCCRPRTRCTAGCPTGSTRWMRCCARACFVRCWARPGRRADPGRPHRVGPGAGVGPGTGGQNDPPQDRVARRGGQSRRLDRHYRPPARASPPRAGAVLHVDGHVRAYAGTRKIAKTHVPRLKSPAPATVESWVSDTAGDPLLVVLPNPPPPWPSSCAD